MPVREINQNQLAQSPQPGQAPQVGPAEAAGREFFTRFVNPLLDLPETLVEIQARGGEKLGPLSVTIPGARFIQGMFEEPRPESEQVDFSGFMPTAEDIQERIASLGELVGATVTGDVNQFLSRDQRLQEQVQRNIAGQEQQPAATTAGSVAADAATLLGGRGAVKLLGKNSSLKFLNEAAPKVAEKAQTILGRAIQKSAQSSQRVLRRAAETGAEAAFLASLRNEDPAEIGAISAGAQAAGDVVARPIFNNLRKVGLTKAVTAATIFSIAAKEVTPGGFQIVEETLKDRGKEIGLVALLTGAPALLTGRVPKGFAGPAFSEIADATTRAGLLGMLEAFRRDPIKMEAVVTQFAEDPDVFGDKAAKKLTRLFTGSPSPGKINRTIDQMAKDDPLFRQQLVNLGAIKEGQ